VGGDWITNATFIDALSVGSALPAPLVIFVAFVGFTASGLTAALVMSAAIVLPAFVITLIGHRRMEQLTSHKRIHGTLDGLTAIVIGFIASTALLLAAGILTSPPTIAIFVIALLWLARVKSRSAVVLIVLIGASLGVTSEAVAATHTHTAITFGRSMKGTDLRATVFAPIATPPTAPSTPAPSATQNPPRLGQTVTTVLVVGQIHGDESAGIAVIRYLRTLPPLSNTRMILVNTINPDGHAARTRQNARGVDLNRNYPTNWRRVGSPFYVFYPGPTPGSERETRAVMNLVREYKPEVTIWYHQHLRCIDRGGKVPDFSRRYAKISKLPLCGNALKYRGTATSWQNATNPDSTAFVVELPAGQLTAAGVRRHARAVREVAAAAARS
jgi:protein MpaA